MITILCLFFFNKCSSLELVIEKDLSDCLMKHSVGGYYLSAYLLLKNVLIVLKEHIYIFSCNFGKFISLSLSKMSVVYPINLFVSLLVFLPQSCPRHLSKILSTFKTIQQCICCVCFCNCSKQSFGFNIITKEIFCMGKRCACQQINPKFQQFGSSSGCGIYQYFCLQFIENPLLSLK